MCYREVTKTIEKKELVVGVYICPVCNTALRQGLPYSINQLPLIIRLTQNRMLNDRSVSCSRCGRSMWLSRVFNREGKLLLDARRFWNIQPGANIF